MATSQLNSAMDRTWKVPGVPVFGYHGLTRAGNAWHPSRERKYWVHEEAFRKQLKLIHDSLFSPCRLDELVQATANVPANSVVLTFDDGLASQYEVAFPLLVEFYTPAYFFVNTGTIGLPGFLTWPQMIEMQACGMSFQSHSHEHVYLSWLSPANLNRQLRDSKRMLEDRLGRQVSFLSAPFGDINQRVIKTARDLGFQAVCNSRSWPARPGKTAINRVVVYAGTSEEDYAGLMTGDPFRYALRAAREMAICLPKRLLVRTRPSPPPAGSLSAVGDK